LIEIDKANRDTIIFPEQNFTSFLSQQPMNVSRCRCDFIGHLLVFAELLHIPDNQCRVFSCSGPGSESGHLGLNNIQIVFHKNANVIFNACLNCYK